MRHDGSSMLAGATIAVLLAIPVPAAHAAEGTKNLVRNGDFEQPGVPPPGWRVNASKGETCDLVSDAMTGRNALRISLPVTGHVTVMSDPCAVTAGDHYLLTFWYRADGMSTKGSHYDGCYANAYILWQDASGKSVASSLASLPYGPVKDYRAATFTAAAPPGADRAVLRYAAAVGKDYRGPATVLFLDQVRLMKLPKVSIPDDAQKWEYVPRRVRAGLQAAHDKHAAQGQAIVARVGTTRKGVPLTYGPDTMAQPVGDYLAIFRLKVKDNTSKEPVASVDVISVGSVNGGLSRRVLHATDFKQPGVYQDFALRFVRPEDGMLEFRVFYQGATDLWLDTKRVVQLRPFATDRERAAIWLGEHGSGAGPAPARRATPAPAHRTALVLAGLGNRTYFPADKLAKTMKLTTTYAYVANTSRGWVLDQPFPRRLSDLNGIGVVVLADVPASALGGLMRRRTLRRFVERGGGLLVFGGPFSLGKGVVAACAFEPALPITTMGPWDMVKAKSRVVQVAKDSPIASGLAWKDRPLLFYYQKTVAKPGADVLLTCDGFPVLVTGQYGKGRVAVFAGTYLGSFAAHEAFFYHWPDYTKLLTRVILWLRNG